MERVAAAIVRDNLGRAAIRAALETFHLAARAGIGRGVRPRGLIFTLHHVRPAIDRAFAPNAHLEVTPEFLDAALGTLIDEGFEPVRLDDLPGLVGSEAAARRCFAVTLDDGYRNNRDYALPVFRRHRVPHTVFVARGFAERCRSAWWETAARLIGDLDEIRSDFGTGAETLPCATPAEKAAAFRRLARVIRSPHEDERIAALDEEARRHGIEPLDTIRDEVMDAAELKDFAADPLVTLGAHTLTHPSLAHVTPERLAEELVGSADYVETITGSRPRALAYPYGDCHSAGRREYDAARTAGFDLAVTTNPGVLDQATIRSQPFALPRISLNGHYQKARYVRALASGLPFRMLGRRSRIEA